MQRELRLGDILDDYCPRERRVTNHAVVAMVGQAVKQTRCTTCDAEHEYKHAKVPRQRRKTEAQSALYSQVVAGAPKRVTHENPAEAEAPLAADATPAVNDTSDHEPAAALAAPAVSGASDPPDQPAGENDREDDADADAPDVEGPVHRPLIRATLPRQEGQVPPARPAPEFTIRQPGGRPGRFRPRNQRGQPFQGNRSNGTSPGMPRGMSRPNSGRPPHGPAPSRLARRHDPGRKRSK
jgi:hypothetical protein